MNSSFNLLSNSTIRRFNELRTSFESATPFKYLCIDDFLEIAFVNALADEFPNFEERYALDEHGKVGGKAVRTDLHAIGGTYSRLADTINSDSFLKSMSSVLGIPNLLSDPSMFGGGTHENLHGQELDPHVDFNYNN